MKHIRSFFGFLNEQNGYGKEPFFFVKDGDSSRYFFKVSDGDKNRGFVLTIGKFSKFTQPTEAKTEYGVLQMTELSEQALDQAVIEDGQFKENEKLISVDQRSLSKIIETVARCVADYLENNGKVSKFYDELPDRIGSSLYRDAQSAAVKSWPGGWNFQEVERGKLNLISK